MSEDEKSKFTEPRDKRDPVKVRKVNDSDMRSILSKHKNHFRVEMTEWGEFDDSVAVDSIAANPCAIVYVRCAGNGHILVGHFLETDSKRYQSAAKYLLTQDAELVRNTHEKANPDQLVIPTKYEEHEFGYNDNFGRYQRYNEFMKRIKHLTKEFGQQSVEVYLFGQSFSINSADLEDMQEALQLRFKIKADIIACGISQNQIRDYRVNSPEGNDVDDTIYIPEDKTIYLYRRKVEELSPFFSR